MGRNVCFYDCILKRDFNGNIAVQGCMGHMKTIHLFYLRSSITNSFLFPEKRKLLLLWVG